MSNQIDKKYLSLQFWKKVHEKNGSDFQGLFSDVMQKVYSDFQKVRPYGNRGDGGNDGYIPSKGVYYQVYAPENPAEKSADAAKKMVDDFNKLKSSGWDEVSKIKEYNFVFNDKNNGLDIMLESTRTQLSSENPNITFKILLPRELEGVFSSLDNDQLVALGFDVDQRKAVEISREYLKGMEVELDRGHAHFVSQTLDTMREIISSQGDEALSLDFEIIEARTLQRLEQVEEAKKKYENIYTRYPKDVRAPLYLAELYLNADNYEENQKLLNAVKGIDASHPLYVLETLIRKVFLKESVSIADTDTNGFPSDPRAKSDYYRIYANLLRNSGDKVNARAFAEQAVHFNPEKLSSYVAKIGLDINNLQSADEEDESTRRGKVDDILKEIDTVSDKFNASGNIGNRNRVYLNYKKAMLLVQSERFEEFASVAKETFGLIFSCHFDNVMDGILTDLLAIVSLPANEFGKLIDCLNAAQKPLSDALAKRMFLQLLDQGTLETSGKEFFKNKNLTLFVGLIEDFEKKDYDAFVSKIKDDNHFAVMACIAVNEPTLRKKIVEALPDNEGIHKDKLHLLLEDEAGNLDAAFALLKKMNLSKIGYVESQKFLDIARRKEAWDFVITFGEKLLTYEKDTRRVLQIKLELFTANLNLDKYPKVISIGESILGNPDEVSMLDEENREILVCQTAYSWLKRGKNLEAKDFIEKYESYVQKFEGKVFLEAEIYIKNRQPEDALKAVVDGVRALKRPSPEEYGSLFLIFSSIGNLMDFPLVSLEKVESNSFLKFKGEERWVFIGDGEELDAIKLPQTNQAEFIGKKVGGKISSSSKYRSEQTEREVENILPIEKYILWQSTHNAQKLSLEGAWDKMEVIEVPQTADGIDHKYLIAKLEDQNKRGQEFFNTYCEQNIPLALLAVSEGGLSNAIGRLANEQKGFIKANTGTLQEMDEQKKVVARIIDGEPFYLDGTSALVLSETGLLEKIYEHLPNLKVPQSVISFLLELKEKFGYLPGQVGHMYFAQGKIGMSSLNQTDRERIENNFAKSVEILESKPENVKVISSASKSDVFSEQSVPPYLSDACILAQRDNIPVLTEDFLYLQMNEIETKKKAPKYCSALAMIKVLHEQGKISFSEYLNLFAYLSSYRFRFLPITIEDLEKAVFGDGLIKTIDAKELRKFNFPLTLSEEYGVPNRTASLLVGHFLIKLLIDDAVLPEVIEKAFAEIISTFPTQDRKLFGKFLLVSCVRAINKHSRGIILGTRVQEKIDLLLQFIQVYNSGGLIVP